MVETVGALQIAFQSSVAKFSRDLDRAAGNVRRQSKRMQFSLNGVSRSLGRMRKNFGAVRGLVAGAIAGGFALATKRAIQFADSIGKTADKAGLAIDSLQELRFAGERVGVASRDTDDALTRLQRRLGLFVQNGGGPAAQAFKALGLEQEIMSSKLRGTEALFNRSIDLLSRVEDQALQSALASQLFGEDAGPRLVNLINQGTDGVERLRARARALGVVLGEDLVRKSESANDKLFEMSQILKINLTRAALRLMPAINMLAETFASPEFISGLTQVGNAVARITKFLVENKNAIIGASIAMIGLLAGFKLAGAKGAAVGALIGVLGGALAFFKLRAQDAEVAAEMAAKGLDQLGDAADTASKKSRIKTPFVPLDVKKAEEAAKAAKKLSDALKQLRQDTEIAVPAFSDLDREAIALARSAGVAEKEIRAFIDAVKQGQAVTATKNKVAEFRAELEKVENIARGKEVVDQTRTAFEEYNTTLAEVKRLLDAGAISQQTYNRAVLQAKESLFDATAATRELTEEQLRLADLSADTGRALADSFREAAIEGKSLGEIIANLEKRLLDLAFNAIVSDPLTDLFASLGTPAGKGINAPGGGGAAARSGFDLGGIIGQLFFDKGGVVGGGRMPAPFAGAPSFDLGGRVGPALRGGARPIIAHDGEGVLTVDQMKELRSAGAGAGGDSFSFNFPGVTSAAEARELERSSAHIFSDAASQFERARRDR